MWKLLEYWIKIPRIFKRTLLTSIIVFFFGMMAWIGVKRLFSISLPD